jgi:hypothetical protein
LDEQAGVLTAHLVVMLQRKEVSVTDLAVAAFGSGLQGSGALQVAQRFGKGGAVLWVKERKRKIDGHYLPSK